MAKSQTNLVEVRRPYVTPRQSCSLSFLDEDGNPQPSLTEQHHKDSCDVIKILNQYDRTGLLTHVAKSAGQYGDFTEINEYQESLDLVKRSTEAFMEIPSEIRKKFDNDPGAFFEFATNPANAAEMVEMGLATPIENPIPEDIKSEETPSGEKESL